MKANKKIRTNKQGVTPVIGTLLMLPVVIMIVSAMLLGSQGLFNNMDDSAEKLELMEQDMSEDGIDINVLVSEGNIIGEDDFEGAQQWHTDYSIHSMAAFDFSHKEHYYTKGHSLEINTNGLYEEHAGIYKEFSRKNLGRICIEIVFTVDENEKYKIFSIYQNDGINNGTIKIDLENMEILCYDGEEEEFVTVAENIILSSEEHCWHHLRLIIDFESDDNEKRAHYIGLTIDDNYYTLRKYKLKNADDDGISSDSLIVKFFNVKQSGPPNDVKSCVDDFAFRDLDMKLQ